MGHLSKAGVLTVRLVQIPRSILGEGFELKDYKTPRDVTVGERQRSRLIMIFQTLKRTSP